MRFGNRWLHVQNRLLPLRGAAQRRRVDRGAKAGGEIHPVEEQPLTKLQHGGGEQIDRTEMGARQAPGSVGDHGKQALRRAG